ncbi:MAG: tocopherol cyclase family protein [Bacteroidia bacterium]|nr:tocopherol cyclase family protein [Bacteroidia bacterium]
MNLRIYKPEIFQGDLKKSNYFEGWYFKHVSQDLNQVWSFIPGIALTKKDPHSFIQVINGTTSKTEYISYPLDEFIWDKNKLYLEVGSSVFTEKYVDLKIENGNLKVEGHIDYTNIVKYPKSLFSPGIMGWYSFIPFMECKHGIVSVNHDLTGNITVNENLIDFNGGKGYIEKDWGTSFPEAWLWIQANNFNDHNTSFTFSVTKIPWRGKFFVGFIAFLYNNKKFSLYSTYNNSVITEINHTDGSISLTLKNHNSVLKVSALRNTFGELRAPASGDMSRRIKESIDSEFNLSLFDKHDNLLYNDSSKRAGIEVIDKIFDLLKY